MFHRMHSFFSLYAWNRRWIKLHWAVVCITLALLASACSSTTHSVSTTSRVAEASLHGLLPENIAKAGLIINGTPETNPPFIYLNKKGQLTGIDYAIEKQLSKELGVHFINKDIPSFSGIIPAILSGRVDMSLSIIVDAPNRERSVNFVDYLITGLTFMGKYGNPDHLYEPEDLCGKVVSNTAGATTILPIEYISDKYCKKAGKPPVITASYSSPAASLLALSSGHAVADSHPALAASYIAAHAGGGREYQLLFPGKIWDAEYYGIALGKNEVKLAQAVVKALRLMLSNGTYLKILKQYNASDAALTYPQITINAASRVPLTPTQKRLYGSSSPFISAS
ncbi:MAG: transporter substrate-binding domain-containing protein [Actinobacteria bacterium]|jgi:polar amino acid transport system substrate-binding protein|nr:transporter substrate-binding domain-containing protein [Actinomycetota bacterium]